MRDAQRLVFISGQFPEDRAVPSSVEGQCRQIWALEVEVVAAA